MKIPKANHRECRFKCQVNFSDDERSIIDTTHWILDDNEKRNFYVSSTAVNNKARSRRARNPNRKQCSVEYFFFKLDTLVRVCKEYYLYQLAVDEKRIRNAHYSRNEITGTPSQYRRGKKPSRVVPDIVKETVRAHIASIPRIESHYCRKDTNK